MDIQDQAQVAANPSLGRPSDDCSRQQAVLRKAVLRKAGMPGQDTSKVIMGIKTLKLEAHELEAVELALRLQPTIASLKDIVARPDAECTFLILGSGNPKIEGENLVEQGRSNSKQ